jgi:hypothetical protein
MLRAKEMMTLPDRQMMIPISVAHEDSLGGDVSAILVVRLACAVALVMSRWSWRTHQCFGSGGRSLLITEEFRDSCEMNQLSKH